MTKHHADAPKQVSDRETAEILKIAESHLATAGDFVELGCYRGDTSVLLERLLEKNASKKRLWIYDSFEGLPKRAPEDGSSAGTEFRKGELLVTKREVVLKFKKAGLRLPIIKKNFFENLDENSDLPDHIAFAFLDGDLYTSIKTSLKLVAPKLDKNGIIIVHDYSNPQLQGVARAVDEWLKTHPNFHLRRFETLAIIE